MILYCFVLVARSRQTGRSHKSIPGDEEVLVVVVLRNVLNIVPGVAAILRYCFFVLGQQQQSSDEQTYRGRSDLLAACECEDVFRTFYQKCRNIYPTTTRLDLLTYCSTMKEVISRVRSYTIGIVGLTRKQKGKYSRRNLSFLQFYNFLKKMLNNKANTSLTVCEKYYFIENVRISNE
jgi:hypothetical protein